MHVANVDFSQSYGKIGPIAHEVRRPAWALDKKVNKDGTAPMGVLEDSEPTPRF